MLGGRRGEPFGVVGCQPADPDQVDAQAAHRLGEVGVVDRGVDGRVVGLGRGGKIPEDGTAALLALSPLDGRYAPKVAALKSMYPGVWQAAFIRN